MIMLKGRVEHLVDCDTISQPHISNHLELLYPFGIPGVPEGKSPKVQAPWWWYVDEDWENYKTAKSKLQNPIRFRRTTAWRCYCRNITSCAHANRIRKIVAN